MEDLTKIKGTKGDTIRRKLAFTETNGVTPFNLTGCAITFTVKEKRNSDSVLFTKIIGSGITVTNASLGEVELKINPSDTNSLPLRETVLFWNLELTDSGNNVQTVDKGILVIYPE